MFKLAQINIILNTNISKLFTSMALIAITGCAAYQPQPENEVLRSRASVPVATQTYADLTSLPDPRGILRAAVYSFRDYSGQYKPQPSNALSTAVTQGADAILTKALLDSNWFAPVERANLQNLLTERKILQSSLADQGKQEVNLPTVAPAEVIIEGSIVSYDSNTQTGGSGLNFLGIGASTAYREDRVTVSIRLIDIDDGLILHNVVSTKRVFSRKLDSGIFSYVDADKILEAEAGFSYNEPSHIAVTEAIESALINLISEGVVSGTLQLANSEDVSSGVFDRFITDSQRQSFLDKTRLAHAREQEQKAFSEAVTRRMRDGIKSLNQYTLALEKKHLKIRQQARKKSNVDNIALTTASTASDNNAARKTLKSDKSAATRGASPAHSIQQGNKIVLTATEQLVANQSQAILKAQAETQVRATRQAHQAAIYAQQLILQREAEIRQQQRHLSNGQQSGGDKPQNQSDEIDQQSLQINTSQNQSQSSSPNNNLNASQSNSVSKVNTKS